MKTLNYYSHVILISKYKILIKFLIYFLVYIIIKNTQVAYCMMEETNSTINSTETTQLVETQARMLAKQEERINNLEIQLANEKNRIVTIDERFHKLDTEYLQQINEIKSHISRIDLLNQEILLLRQRNEMLETQVSRLEVMLRDEYTCKCNIS